MSKISLKHSGGKVVSLNSPTTEPTSNDVAFKLPNADGSANEFLKTDGSGNLSFVSAGITMAHQWRQHTGVEPTANTNTTLQNWESTDSPAGYGGIGSNMTESSGVFTFPTTGIYLIKFTLVMQSANGSKTVTYSNIFTTLDNTNYSTAAQSRTNMMGTDVFSSCLTEYIFDVTNTTTHKVKFVIQSAQSQTFTIGNTTQTFTGVTFIRLGDT